MTNGADTACGGLGGEDISGVAHDCECIRYQHISNNLQSNNMIGELRRRSLTTNFIFLSSRAYLKALQDPPRAFWRLISNRPAERRVAYLAKKTRPALFEGSLKDRPAERRVAYLTTRNKMWAPLIWRLILKAHLMSLWFVNFKLDVTSPEVEEPCWGALNDVMRVSIEGGS